MWKSPSMMAKGAQYEIKAVREVVDRLKLTLKTSETRLKLLGLPINLNFWVPNRLKEVHITIGLLQQCQQKDILVHVR